MCALTFGYSLDSLGTLLPQTGFTLWLYCHLLAFFVRRQLHAQGTGRHSRDEIFHISIQDVQALQSFIGGTLESIEKVD